MPGDGERQGTWRRFGVFGDRPTRFLKYALGWTPWFLEPLLVPVWTLIFWGLARRQRRAVESNLAALFPGWGGWRTLWGSYRVFVNFAWTFVDAMRVETGTGEVEWEIEGLESFRDLESREEGCLILTVHMGNYDMAASIFSGKFRRTIHAVRAPEREPEMQALREAELRERERRYPRFRTHYNLGGEMLGVELARYLAEGDVVAVQGDRVVFDVSPMTVEVEEGLRMTLPRGPLYLARVSGAPVYPLFIVRAGWRKYRIEVWPKLSLPPRRRAGRGQARGEDEAAGPWAKTLLEGVKKRWWQWYVFEELFERSEGGEA